MFCVFGFAVLIMTGGYVFKRMLDIVMSALLLTMLSPLLMVVAIASFFFMGSPIFFRQARAGLKGKTFNMIKFRTMRPECDSNGVRVPDKLRVTKFGRFLRATSLDELPELWNILIGNMSLVGPRPLLVEYLPYYSETESRRHDVRPGLTGLAQVSGRNSLSWEDRLALDVEYVDNVSFVLDVKILIKTFFKVFMRSDVQIVTGGSNRLDDMRRENRTEFHDAQ